ncbi:uncharacterized protein LOC124655928 [Lolium rigidum]|uniref:uncharacterized protein LOC124655928 n=1 Tax=Lolium rigidum TaxID=89674 RepID=UPI001F5DB7B5|nr:uncharacterized protein LOC124655928 [Lolium rigidum]
MGQVHIGFLSAYDSVRKTGHGTYKKRQWIYFTFYLKATLNTQHSARPGSPHRTVLQSTLRRQTVYRALPGSSPPCWEGGLNLLRTSRCTDADGMMDRQARSRAEHGVAFRSGVDFVMETWVYSLGHQVHVCYYCQIDSQVIQCRVDRGRLIRSMQGGRHDPSRSTRQEIMCICKA